MGPEIKAVRGMNRCVRSLQNKEAVWKLYSGPGAKAVLNVCGASLRK